MHNSGDGIREKVKKKKPLKVIMRRLPCAMTWDELREQISPIPHSEYVSFVAADRQLDPHGFSRCYFAFTEDGDVLDFCNRFNGYVFVDSKGNESVALVEFAPFFKIPRKRMEDVSKDTKCGTIEQEIEYKRFMDDLDMARQPSVMTLEEQLRHVQMRECDMKASVVQSTPLTQFMIRKNDEKYRKIEERRRAKEEERRERYNRLQSDKYLRENEEKKNQLLEFTNSRRSEAKEIREKHDKDRRPVKSGTDKRKDESKKDLDEKREDWEKFKRDLGIGVDKKMDDGGVTDNKDCDKLKRDDKRSDPNKRPERFIRSERPVRTERVTAMSSESTDKIRKPKDRPEREIYRPGMKSRKTVEKKEESK